MTVAFLLRSDTELTVQRDRSPNFVRLSNGDIRNSYTLKILNKDRRETAFHVALDGLPSATLSVVGADREGAADQPDLVVHPDAVGTFRVLVTVPADRAPAGSKSIAFTVHDAARTRRTTHDAVFVGPGR